MKTFNHFIALLIFASFSVGSAMAQTTAFTYQGKLTDSGNLANAAYDMQFKLFDALTNGNQIGATLTFDGNSGNPPSVSVTNGIFTVNLDFGSAALSGADRYLEISLKPAGNPGGYQQLLPRQKLTSAPYSVQALKATTATNATQLGGVAASQYVVTSDTRLSDARQPLAGSANYIQNTGVVQSADFNIDGDGTANLFNARTEFQIGGQHALSVRGNQNVFAGVGAGAANTTGDGNVFFGYQAGLNNTTGSRNSFFGGRAGESNTTNNGNSFFGYHAGILTTGSSNSFFGDQAGSANTLGSGNSFFGVFAGQFNTGSLNSFFGNEAGQHNSTGGSNIFIGEQAGISNTTGSNNTIIGTFADVGSSNLSFVTAIGSGAVASLSNSIYLGRADGSDAVRIPGPVVIDGSLVVGTLGSAGSTSICLNVANRIAPCSSSLRYKTNVQPFTGGLDIVRRLRPISFTWKDGGMSDVGFAAEEVQRIAPLLATYNKDGQIEGVKYGQITTVLVNAVKQQQTQIEAQQSQIEAQKQQLAAQQLALQQQQQQNQAQQNQLRQQQQQFATLKKLVCSSHRQAAICQ